MSVSCSIPFEVPFYDVDAYQVVWHGNYPKYWEMARCHLLEKIGIPYSEMQKHGFFYPVVEMNTKYIQPLVFGQKIELTATLTEWQNRLVIKYTAVDQSSGQVCTKAWTKQVAVSMPDNITQYISPDFIVNAVDAWLASHAD